jgi:hypothetical protein
MKEMKEFVLEILAEFGKIGQRSNESGRLSDVQVCKTQ